MYGTISCCIFKHCNVFILHSFHRVALFACSNFYGCTFLILHYFQKCSQYPHKILRWRALQQKLICKVVKYCCKPLHLRCSRGPGFVYTIFMLHSFHVAFLNIEKILKTKERQEIQPRKRHDTRHRELVLLLH